MIRFFPGRWVVVPQGRVPFLRVTIPASVAAGLQLMKNFPKKHFPAITGHFPEPLINGQAAGAEPAVRRTGQLVIRFGARPPEWATANTSAGKAGE